MNGKRIATLGSIAALVAVVAFGAQDWSSAETVAPASVTKLSPPAAKTAEVAKAVVSPATVAPEAKPQALPVKVEAPKVEKTTILPDGKVLIENKKVTLRYANGKTEERYVKITATPVQKPMKRVMRKKPE